MPDVYQGLDGVQRGDVKFIRIAQRVGWPLDAETGAKRWIPGNAWERKFGFWSWAPVRVIGTVPVAPDGSACFAAPPDIALYFQALDANRMELRRMRTHVTLKRGEMRGCTGCHETQTTTPSNYAVAKAAALRRPAAWPTPPPFGNRELLGYEAHIQPIFEKHCVRCHGPGKQEGGLDFSGARAADGFLQSFRALFGMKPEDTKPSGKKLVSVSDRFSNHSVSAVRQFGSHKSPLVLTLLEDPLHQKESPLTEDEWETLVTWVDANAPYYNTFFHKRPPGGGEPVWNFQLPPFPAFEPKRPTSASTNNHANPKPQTQLAASAGGQPGPIEKRSAGSTGTEGHTSPPASIRPGGG